MRDTAFEETREQIANKALPCFSASLMTLLILSCAIASSNYRKKGFGDSTFGSSQVFLRLQRNAASIAAPAQTRSLDAEPYSATTTERG
jgi:hypothetical protein